MARPWKNTRRPLPAALFCHPLCRESGALRPVWRSPCSPDSNKKIGNSLHSHTKHAQRSYIAARH